MPTGGHAAVLVHQHIDRCADALAKLGGIDHVVHAAVRRRTLGARLRLAGEECGFFALGEIGEYEEGVAVKAIKTFFPQ